MSLRGGTPSAIAIGVLLLAALMVPLALAQSDTRSVEGVVSDSQGAAISGAIVKLEDTRTLAIRSFITQADGKYFFHGLSKSVDYTVKAERDGKASGEKTISKFNNRDRVVINLRITG